MNDQKGSKPIPLETGGVTVTSVEEEVSLDRREAAATQLSVEVDCSTLIGEAQLLQELAAARGLPVSAFSLSEDSRESLATAQVQCESEGTLVGQRRGRQLLSLTYTILVDATLAAGTTSELAAAMLQLIASVARRLNATVIDAWVADGPAAYIYVNVTRNVTREEDHPCPAGSWVAPIGFKPAAPRFRASLSRALCTQVRIGLSPQCSTV